MIFGEMWFVQSPRLPDRLVTTNGVKVAARYLEHVSPEPTCSFSRPKTIHHPMKTSSLGQGCQVPRTFIKEKTLLSWGFHRSKQVFIELRSPSTKLDKDKELNVVQRSVSCAIFRTTFDSQAVGNNCPFVYCIVPDMIWDLGQISWEVASQW